MTAIALLPF